MKNNSDWKPWPTEPGWWWCRPSTESIWFEIYPDGCVVQIHYDNGWRDSVYRPDLEGVYATGSLYGREVGIDTNNPEGLFGSWVGPLEPPVENERALVIEADFVVLSEVRATIATHHELD